MEYPYYPVGYPLLPCGVPPTTLWSRHTCTGEGLRPRLSAHARGPGGCRHFAADLFGLRGRLPVARRREVEAGGLAGLRQGRAGEGAWTGEYAGNACAHRAPPGHLSKWIPSPLGTLSTTPSIQCSTPSSLCGTPSALCGTPSALCSTPVTPRTPWAPTPVDTYPLGTQLSHSGGRYLGGYIPMGLGA